MKGGCNVNSINNSLEKKIKLVNFKAPIDLLEKFDDTVEKIWATRTQVLLHLMDIFIKIYEGKDQQVCIIKKA